MVLWSKRLPSADSGEDTIRAPELAKLLGVTPKTLYAWAEAGRFPKPVRLGPRTHVFPLAAVRAALEKMEREASVPTAS